MIKSTIFVCDYQCVCVCEQIGRSERICLYFSPSKTSKNCELYGWLLTGSLYSTFCQCKSCQDDGVLCTTIFTYNVSHIAKIDEHMDTCMRTIRIIRRLGCPIFGSNRLSEHLALKCKNALPFFFLPGNVFLFIFLQKVTIYSTFLMICHSIVFWYFAFSFLRLFAIRIKRMLSYTMKCAAIWNLQHVKDVLSNATHVSNFKRNCRIAQRSHSYGTCIIQCCCCTCII